MENQTTTTNLERLEIVKTFSKNIVLYSNDEIKKRMVKEYEARIKELETKNSGLTSVIKFQEKNLTDYNSEISRKNRRLDQMEFAVVVFIAITFLMLLGIYNDLIH